MAIIKPQAFTLDYKTRANMLLIDCGACEAFVPSGKVGEAHPHVHFSKALWDTGASCSVITKKIVSVLKLVPTGKQKVYHANGDSVVNTYFINIILPNQVAIPNLRVTEGILSGFDMLIGMDVITRGDFSICNINGKTKFSFQIPSTHNTDYVNEITIKESTPIVKEKKTQRNDLCPCGSGKKYKNCHGEGL